LAAFSLGAIPQEREGARTNEAVMTDLQAIVEDIHATLSPRRGEGRVADYIPQLAHVGLYHRQLATFNPTPAARHDRAERRG